MELFFAKLKYANYYIGELIFEFKNLVALHFVLVSIGKVVAEF